MPEGKPEGLIEETGTWMQDSIPWHGSWKALGNAMSGDPDPVFILSGGLMSQPKAPGSQDYASVANQQLWANRPNQQNAFGSNVQWTQGPDGRWYQQQSFNGPMGGLATNLQQQAAHQMGLPFDLRGLPEMQSGESARDQAIKSAYGQAQSRLDPQWQQREQSMRSQLINQGLDPSSEAYQTAMGNLGRDRNDAYTSAMNMAVGQGTAAGDSVFRNSLMGRQQGLSEMLRQRQQPMQDLLAMQGLMQQPGFNQSNDMLTAAIAQGNFDMGKFQAENQQQADLFSGLGNLGGAVAGMLSDERAKVEVRRLDVEVLPGVPLATWRYRQEFDPKQRLFIGVIAQDLEKVAPDYVHLRPDGLKSVDYSFLDGVLS
jgi:hypothetical protein